MASPVAALEPRPRYLLKRYDVVFVEQQRMGLPVYDGRRSVIFTRGKRRVTGKYLPVRSVTPLLPEAQRNHVTAGLGWSRGRMAVDLAYQFIAHADRRGRTVNPPPGQLPTVALNSGVYRSTGNLLGLTITFRP